MPAKKATKKLKKNTTRTPQTQVDADKSSVTPVPETDISRHASRVLAAITIGVVVVVVVLVVVMVSQCRRRLVSLDDTREELASAQALVRSPTPTPTPSPVVTQPPVNGVDVVAAIESLSGGSQVVWLGEPGEVSGLYCQDFRLADFDAVFTFYMTLDGKYLFTNIESVDELLTEAGVSPLPFLLNDRLAITVELLGKNLSISRLSTPVEVSGVMRFEIEFEGYDTTFTSFMTTDGQYFMTEAYELEEVLGNAGAH